MTQFSASPVPSPQSSAASHQSGIMIIFIRGIISWRGNTGSSTPPTFSFMSQLTGSWKWNVQFHFIFIFRHYSYRVFTLYQSGRWSPPSHEDICWHNAGVQVPAQCSVDIFAGLSFRWRGHCSVDSGDVDTENMITPLSINTGLVWSTLATPPGTSGTPHRPADD